MPNTLARVRSPHYGRRWGALLLVALAACNEPKTAIAGGEDPDAVRYRLELRDNAVDPGAAFRCYGNCQSAGSPDSYLDCLSKCPGFEVTQGATCAKTEIPPETVCLTGRKLRPNEQANTGQVVVATLAGIAIVVAAASLCASSSSQCGYYGHGP
jgi:hypothetical protein